MISMQAMVNLNLEQDSPGECQLGNEALLHFTGQMLWSCTLRSLWSGQISCSRYALCSYPSSSPWRNDVKQSITNGKSIPLHCDLLIPTKFCDAKTWVLPSGQLQS